MRLSFSPLTPLPQAVLTILYLCFLICTVSQEASAKAAYAIKSPQPWVRPLDLESEGKSGLSSSSSTFLLDDHQIRVSKATVDRYYHHVQKVETTAGLDDISQVRLYFEPSYQQLAIHYIRLRRDGSLIDVLRSSEIKVIQQEEGLDQQLYNGTLAAIVFLNDLRVGDVVDYAYTVSGENPVFAGRYAEALYLADGQPIHHLNFRLVWPSERTIKIRNANIGIVPKVTTVGNETEYVWERREVPAIDVEDKTPAWFNPYPTVSLSEFQTWHDVVQWALPLYASAPIPPALLSKVHKWQAEFTTPEERTVAALRFVQDEIRYLGIELGRYSHQPTLPAKVFARRFGDCKDKSLLLVTILKSLGVDATTALVDSTAGRSLDQQQPSPFAFDHVIVRARIDGRTYWFDPTMSYQRGGLDKYYDPPYERALELRDGVTGLEKIPLASANSGRIVISEKYEGKNSQGPITLLVSTTYVGGEADRMRYELSRGSLSELSKTYLNFYGEENPSIKAEGLPQVEDDTVANKIVVKEQYLIDGFWKDRKHNFYADRIYEETKKPNVTQRTMPMRIRFPVSIDHTIEVDFSERYDVSPDSGTISNNVVRFDYDISSRGSKIRLHYSFKTFGDSIPVEQIPQHLLVLDRINYAGGFELSSGTGVFGYTRTTTNRIGAIVVGVVLIAGLLLIGCVAFILTRLKPKTTTRFAETLKAKVGFAPESAISVRHEADIDPALRAFRCSCGQAPYRPEDPPQADRFTYDGQRLIGIRLKCLGCRRISDLYFKPWSQPLDEGPSPQTNY